MAEYLSHFELGRKILDDLEQVIIQSADHLWYTSFFPDGTDSGANDALGFIHSDPETHNRIIWIRNGLTLGQAIMTLLNEYAGLIGFANEIEQRKFMVESATAINLPLSWPMDPTWRNPDGTPNEDAIRKSIGPSYGPDGTGENVDFEFLGGQGNVQQHKKKGQKR